MAIKIAVTNIKGGIGKSSTAICLAGGLIKKRKEVLLIDADPNSMSSTGVYKAETDGVGTLADILYSGDPAETCIQHTALGDIIPCDKQLKNADTQIPPDADRFYHLVDACPSLEAEYDFIIVDCPPGDGVILGNVLSYVDYVIMPITCDRFGLECIADFQKAMNIYKQRINEKLSVLGILITMYEGRQSLTRELEDKFIPGEAEKLGTKVFNTRIRRSVKLKESQMFGKTIYDHAPKSTVAQDYEELTNEVIKRTRLLRKEN